MSNRKDHQLNEPATRGQEEVRDSKNAPPRSQKGPQAHAEGQHGAKTHRRLAEQLNEGKAHASREEKVARDRERGAYDGSRRLVEDRQQHDEAEKNSEHTRLHVEHELGRDRGPSDNTGNLHGVLGHREARADYKERDSKGLPSKD